MSALIFDIHLNKFINLNFNNKDDIFIENDDNNIKRKFIEIKTDSKLSKYNEKKIYLPKYSIYDNTFFTFYKSIEKIKRCSKCILPSTIPFIQFDEKGVCSVCNGYKKVEVLGEDLLRLKTARFNKNVSGFDSIIALSGGRDSSYGLHYIKTKLGLNPLAYTYDWGMVTDLARRNISRLCSMLGVEHIVISADIKKKRNNIRKNVLAWLKNPEIGLIPLFMAGDKQFFYFVNKLKKETGIENDIWCFNIHEKADFKEELSGIKMWNYEKDSDKRVAVEMRFSSRLKLAFYYLYNFIKNPSYINSSLFDSFFAYISYYFVPKNYTSIYDYIKWDEKLIESTIINQYEWETSPDTPTTWRIGDGTAPFYNYIYFTVCGYSEIEWFRSNQIRENMLTRSEALDIAMKENLPRWDSIKWYLDTIDIDFDFTLKIINNIKKHYNL